MPWGTYHISQWIPKNGFYFLPLFIFLFASSWKLLWRYFITAWEMSVTEFCLTPATWNCSIFVKLFSSGTIILRRQDHSCVDKHSYFLPLRAIFKVQWVKVETQMTQQLVTIHGCKSTDASVVISSHMHSTGGGSTAGGFGRQGSLWRWEWKRIQTRAASLSSSQALVWSPTFWWGWHPSLAISSWAQRVVLWQLMALAQSPGCVPIPSGTWWQPHVKRGTAGAREGDPV